jgi:enolase
VKNVNTIIAEEPLTFEQNVIDQMMIDLRWYAKSKLGANAILFLAVQKQPLMN